MDSEDDVRLTSFRPLSPDTSQSSFSLARLFQRKRPEARVEVKIDSTKKHRPVSPLVSPRSSPQLQKRVSTTKNPELPRSWSASPLIGRRRTSAPGSVGIGSRRNSPGYRNVHAVLGRLNAAADGRGQVSLGLKIPNGRHSTYWSQLSGRDGANSVFWLVSWAGIMAPVRFSYNPIHLLCIHVSTVFVLNYSGERPSSNVNLFL